MTEMFLCFLSVDNLSGLVVSGSPSEWEVRGSKPTLYNDNNHNNERISRAPFHVKYAQLH